MSETTERLDAIQGRLGKVTPGPWEVDAMDAGHSRYEMNVWVAAGNGDQVCDMDGLNRSRNEEVAKDDGFADAEFIANAPSDVAYLLTLARKQAAALERVGALAMDWETRGESDIKFSKSIHDEFIAMALLMAGADKVEDARHIRNALEATK